MMNFEDIVDMDWVDSHTTLENSGEYCFDYQPNFLLEQPATPPQQPAMIEPEIKIEPLTSMPTTEQIKQLIEIAKRQLALREQLQQQQQQTQEAQQQVLQDQPLFLSTQTAAEVQTAAPSTIFAPPPPPPVAPTSSTTPTMPALSPTTITSTDMTLPPLPPLLTDLEMFDQPKQSSLSSNSHADTTSTSSMGRRDSLASMTEESISLEAYAEADGIDLKKLTPKERRQLRNKISARNFRVRRKG
jgi:type II secretory pathway pseudopilin PulG